jgi:hypothetical protein
MHSRAIASLALALSALTGASVPAAARPSAATPATGRAPVHGAQVVGSVQSIDVNHISMVVTNQGSIAYNQASSAAGFEYPKGSGNTAIFAAGPWLGAMAGGELRVAVSEYTDEFRPGTITGAGLPDDPHRAEYKVYKLARTYADPAVRDAVLADYTAGAVPFGAPPVSVLGDGTLSIPGDQMLWCVFNDADPTGHQSGLGQTAPLGVEVQLTAFAFLDPLGAAGRTVFLRYKFIHKGATTLHDLYLGMWADPDLGGYTDDLVGGDPARGMGYVYNAANTDQQYGTTPPAVGIDLLAGPGGLGLTSFGRYVNGGDPSNALQVYHVLQGLLASGAPAIDPTTSLPAKFQVTGDPVAGTGWLDDTPSDRRMLLGSGPLTLSPGQSLDVTYAIVVGQGSNRLSSILELRCDDDAIQAFHDRAFAPPLPAPAECGHVVNCPRPANWWSQQFAPVGGVYTPAQLAEIANRVDAASLHLDLSVDPVASLADVLDPAAATTPRTRALREYAAFQCNLAVTVPPAIVADSPPARLDPATPITCEGVPGTSLAELAATAAIGLSDAAYVDVGPNPPALVGVDVGLPLWGGAAGYADDLFGSSIPSGGDLHDVEIRFTGGTPGQYAYRYLRTLEAGIRVYRIQDYVPVPFTVWDLDTGTPLNAAFLENDGAPTHDGQWNPDESTQGGRELVWAMDSPYSGDATPDPGYFNDPDLTDMLLGQIDLRYVMWPRRESAGAVIDDGDRFRFTWGGIVPGPGVDVMLFQLAALPPGDPAATQGYAAIVDCLSGVNAGIGIGETCDVPTATDISNAGTEVGSGRVTVRWYVAGDVPEGLHVERREGEAAWADRQDVRPDGRGMIEFHDTDIVAGHAYDYRLRVVDGGGTRWLGQVSVRVPLASVLGLEGFHPNPAERDIQVAFTLASRAPATLTVFDLAGRRLFARDVGGLGAGRHVVPLGPAGRLRSGIYLLQLSQEGRTVTRRAAAIR